MRPNDFPHASVGGVKTSGAKGVHVFVPLEPDQEVEDVAAATRALAHRAAALDEEVATTAFVREEREGKVFVDSTRSGGATVVAAYSPRVRPGLPVSFPVTWDELARAISTAGPEPPSLLKVVFHGVAGSEAILASWLTSPSRDADGSVSCCRPFTSCPP